VLEINVKGVGFVYKLRLENSWEGNKMSAPLLSAGGGEPVGDQGVSCPWIKGEAGREGGDGGAEAYAAWAGEVLVGDAAGVDPLSAPDHGPDGGWLRFRRRDG
jgi:hypothetical protein